MTFDNCFANSVFPTPVGPVNKKQPTGLSGSDNPAWEILIERAKLLTALSCPYINFFIFLSKFFAKRFLWLSILYKGIFTILEIVLYMSGLSINFFLLSKVFL